MEPETKTKTLSLTKIDMAVGAVFLALIATVSWFLFATSGNAFLMDDVARSERLIRQAGTFTIAYDQPLETYEPTDSSAVTRAYLSNTYDGLVQFDQDFNLKPALALSWGMLGDTTWQFKLRPNVIFHDGSIFDAEDVVVSLERAGLVAIERVEVVDDLTIRVETTDVYPMLLNALTTIWMVPSETGADVRTPIGTGPYRFLVEQEEEWQFERFSDYWGKAPSYPELVLKYVPDKLDRFDGILNGEIDVLAQTPPGFVDALLEAGYPIASLPTLEVNFLLFDWQDSNSPFRHDALREAVVSAIDTEALTSMASDYAHPINQFVSRGVFGYNPDLDGIPYDPQHAEEVVDDLGGDWALTLDVPAGLEDSLGAYVEESLETIGLNVTVQGWEADDYATRIDSGQSNFYFLAWRSDLGNASDFFNHVAYGRFNDGLDQLIDIADRNLLEAVRLEQFQDLMTEVVEDEIIGIPLFESDSLITIQPELHWEPRMDNLILAADFY